MAAGSTYTPIATTTASGSVSSITFSSIPSTYTDLVLVANAALSSADSVGLQFNSDTGTNYSATWVYGSGTTAVSGRNSTVANMSIGAIGSVQSSTIISIFNYANTTTYKTALGRGDATDYLSIARVGLWRSTSAINSVTFKSLSGFNFTSTSYFTLYGIAAA